MNITQTLFLNLSYKFKNENDLSDITWSFCETSEYFKQLFLNFFFPNIEFSNIKSFNRELVKDDSRADFVIISNEEKFVIECKINDKNHHFEQYLNAYSIKKENLGYIVNYNEKYKDFEIKTWEKLYDYLIKNTPTETEERKLFNGYLEYLRNVCKIVKIKDNMNIYNTRSLYNFNTVLKSLLNVESINYNLNLKSKDFKEEYCGYKFELCSNNKENITLNVGLWINNEIPVLTLGIDKRGNIKSTFDDDLEQNNFKGKYSKKEYSKGTEFYFIANEKFYQKFHSIELDEQKKILSDFIKEIIEFYLENKNYR